MSLVIDYSNGVFEAVPSGETVGTDPATIGDPNFANVSLLLHGDGTSGSTTITDSSSSPKTVTVNGNAQIDTAVKKFGTGSIEFDGTNSELTLASGLIGSGDFTIEYFVQGDTSDGYHFDFNGTNRLSIWYEDTTASSAFEYSINVYDTNYRGQTNSLPFATYTGGFNHIAIVRSSGTMKIYINGTSIASWSNSLDYSDAALTIGNADRSFDKWMEGFIDEIRISNVARYTSNFTAPTAAFSDQGPTIDATTGNVFNHSPSADVAYTFSNPPTTGSAYDFTLKVAPTATVAITWPCSVKWAGGTAPSAPANGEKDVYNFFTLDGGTTYYGFQGGDDFTALPTLDGASVEATTYSTNQSYINGLFVAPDEDKFAITQPLPDDVINYTMSTAGDLSTVSAGSTVVDVTSTDPHMIYMGPVGQGTQTWISRNNSNELKVFTNSTAWVMNTATGTSYSLGANDAEAFWFSNDGYYLFRVSTFDLRRFPLSTAWDISTAGSSTNIDMTSKVGSITAIQDMWMDSSGRRAFLAQSGSSGIIEEYNLTTAYDFSSAVYTGNSLSPTGGVGGFSVVGQNLYVANGTVQGDGKVRKYILGYN